MFVDGNSPAFESGKKCHEMLHTVMIVSFQTDSSGQTVQTQIRLLLEEQSDQGLHCLLSICFFLTKYTKVWSDCLNFR